MKICQMQNVRFSELYYKRMLDNSSLAIQGGMTLFPFVLVTYDEQDMFFCKKHVLLYSADP